MKIEELKKQIKEGTAKGVYVFTGEERELIRKYLKKLNTQQVGSVNEAIKKLSTKGLFNTGVKCLHIEGNKEVFETDFKQLEKVTGKNILVIVVDKVDSRKKFFKEAKKNTIEFNKLSLPQLIKYIQKFIDVDGQLAGVIAHFSNLDIARVEMECHKLSHYNGEITIDVIDELLTPPVEDAIFDMIDGVAKRDKERVFEIYYDLLELNESPIKIISLLYTKFKQVFLVQSMGELGNSEIAGKTGMTPFQVKNAREITGRFTLSTLMQHLRKIQLTEMNIKMGKIDMRQGLDNLLVDILKEV